MCGVVLVWGAVIVDIVQTMSASCLDARDVMGIVVCPCDALASCLHVRVVVGVIMGP